MTVAANDAASSNDVCRSNAAGANDRRRKKSRNGQRPGQRLAAERSPAAQNSPGKDRLLGVGCWLRRERVRTFIAVCYERCYWPSQLLLRSQGSAVAQGYGGTSRAAPSRLIARNGPQSIAFLFRVGLPSDCLGSAGRF